MPVLMMIFGVLKNPYVLAALAFAGLLTAIKVEDVRLHHAKADLATARAQVGTLQAQAVLKGKQDAATAKVEASQATAQAQIQTVYRTVNNEVIRYVPAKADAGCIVNNGAVRVLNAGAAGVPVVPDPAGGPDDAASGVALSTLVSTSLANDQAARANSAQLVGLQDWVRAQSAIKP